MRARTRHVLPARLERARERVERWRRTLVREKEQLGRELQRAQALVRAAQRSVGITSFTNGSRVGAKGKGTKRRTRRVTVRTERTIEALRQPPEVAASIDVVAKET